MNALGNERQDLHKSRSGPQGSDDRRQRLWDEVRRMLSKGRVSVWTRVPAVAAR